MRLTKQQIEKAVSWWGKVLKNPKYDNGDESENSAFAKALIHLNKTALDNDIKKFRDNLREILKIKDCSIMPNFTLFSEYGPCFDLSKATKDTNINELNFPWKTVMVFKKDGRVLVRYGSRSEWKEI